MGTRTETIAPPFYRAIQGKLVIIGKQPDGDSVRFIPDRRQAFRGLYRDDRIRPSRTDGSVQLRFEAVDAPELHYGRYAQPLGDQARENDLVLLLDSVETMPSVEVQLSDLVRQSNRTVFLQPDLLDLVFVEK